MHAAMGLCIFYTACSPLLTTGHRVVGRGYTARPAADGADPSAHLEDLTSALVDFVSRYPVQPGQRLQQNGGCMGLCTVCNI